MDFDIFDFRHAHDLLSFYGAWRRLEAVVRNIEADALLGEQAAITALKGSAPKGGQQAINSLFARRLAESGGWISQPRLFDSPQLSKWTMDFVAERVGVEISFNHAEAIAWQLTRLNIACESDVVKPESRIDVGIVICAASSLKTWSKMDGSVGTLENFRSHLTAMKPVLHVPILVVGLKTSGWKTTEVFPGTTRTSRGTVLESEVLPTNDT